MKEPIDKKAVLTTILAAAQPIQNYALGMALAKQDNIQEAIQSLSSAAIEDNPLVADLNTVMRNLYKEHADLERAESAETYALLTLQWAEEKGQEINDQEARRIVAFTTLVDAFEKQASKELASGLLTLLPKIDDINPTQEELTSWNQAIENQ